MTNYIGLLSDVDLFSFSAKSLVLSAQAATHLCCHGGGHGAGGRGRVHHLL